MVPISCISPAQQQRGGLFQGLGPDMAAAHSAKGASSDLKVLTLHDLIAHKDDEVAACAKLAYYAVRALPEAQRATMLEPVEELMNNLVEERSQAPDKDPIVSQLDAAIFPINQLVRKMFAAGPYSTLHESAPAPSSLTTPVTAVKGANFMQDLTHANLLHEVSDLLGTAHLLPASDPCVQGPIYGILYGPYHRPLVCLPTAVGYKSSKNIIYLVDTCAPITELSPAAFEALGFTEAIPSAAWAYINGVLQQVKLCEPAGTHPDIPVLGADAMISIGVELRVNYRTEQVTLHL